MTWPRPPGSFAARRSDELAACELAANPDISDEIVGFHAQQAVEKWLKAEIAARRERFKYTHDLRRLLNLAIADGPPPAVDRDSLIELTQYSVPLRYEDLLDAEPLDRESTIELVAAVGRWAVDRLTQD
jgi:HEPN domain-containing protein